MSDFEIVIDPTRCRSMGVCVQLAPNIFELDEKTGVAVVVVKEPKEPNFALAREAAEQCPTQAIRLISCTASGD